ncbi:creatininase family protein [Nocardiopsis sp. NPDC050513]|uniref:creatininase family protein n=1 Tax=Nocardiopsis sp. NPDC050513 TaxID=3364338 RepID=UPI00379E3B03
MTFLTESRGYTSLTAPQVPASLGADSVLCLPVGACEQHGPHLPLDTDTTIAERFTELVVSRYGPSHDLWALPAIPYGLSLEHGWSPGTVSLSIASFTALLDDVIRAHLRATPARRILIVNGHGGNRGILQTCAQELRDRYPLALGVVHPVALSEVRFDGPMPDIHAGVVETSLMLALAPERVRLDNLAQDHHAAPHRAESIRRRIIHRGTTWPWSSDDPAISSHGVIGANPRDASPELGWRIIDSALAALPDVLATLASTDPQTPERR